MPHTQAQPRKRKRTPLPPSSPPPTHMCSYRENLVCVSNRSELSTRSELIISNCRFTLSIELNFRHTSIHTHAYAYVHTHI